MRPPYASLWIRSLSKSDLHQLIAEVKRGDAEARSRAVVFVASESFGMWHNRARAKLCRYFKNHPPPEAERTRMINAIVTRLHEGHFYEQFKDQLSMAIRFAPKRLETAALVAMDSDRAYIRRYGQWVQHVVRSTAVTATVSGPGSN